MKQILLIILIVGFFAAGFSYLAYLDDTTCDEHVVTVDGEEYDCTRVNSYSSGMSSLKLCDDRIIEMPTTRIKEVTRIEK